MNRAGAFEEALLENFVFAAYRHDDRAIVEPVLSTLRQAGVELWDHRTAVAPGALWEEEIGKALQRASYVIAIVTKKALESKWLVSEITAAFLQNKLTVILLEDVPPASLPVDIAKLRSLNLAGADAVRIDAEVRKLANNIINPPMFSFAGRRKDGEKTADQVEILSDRWLSLWPAGLTSGDTYEISLDLQVSELEALITRMGLEDHPLFGTSDREPTVAVRMLTLSKGLAIRDLNSALQWVSNYFVKDQEPKPIVWSRQIVAEAAGIHEGRLQLSLVAADRSGVRIEQQLLEVRVKTRVRRSKIAMAWHFAIWLANSVGAGLIGYYISQVGG